MTGKKEEALRREREEAWLGDAVLSLHVREWILARDGRLNAALFAELTSNHFLSRAGSPTGVEAAIGREYRDKGLAAAREWITQKLGAAFERHANQRHGRK